MNSSLEDDESDVTDDPVVDVVDNFLGIKKDSKSSEKNKAEKNLTTLNEVIEGMLEHDLKRDKAEETVHHDDDDVSFDQDEDDLEETFPAEAEEKSFGIKHPGKVLSEMLTRDLSQEEKEELNLNLNVDDEVDSSITSSPVETYDHEIGSDSGGSFGSEDTTKAEEQTTTKLVEVILEASIVLRGQACDECNFKATEYQVLEDHISERHEEGLERCRDELERTEESVEHKVDVIEMKDDEEKLIIDLNY